MTGSSTSATYRSGMMENMSAKSPPTPPSASSLPYMSWRRLQILGGPEKYMTVGSSLRLVCVLRDNTQPPSYVFWYHDELMINYHATREVRVENNGGVSVLFLNNVRPADSGNYTCSPSNTRPAHISIHVLKGGETPAAIHSGGARCCCCPVSSLMVLVTTVLWLTSHHLRPASYTTGVIGRDQGLAVT
ncbi:uncharacterized protein LOC121859225 [Homarus americanus]|uniref:uncharacterized protein LOC121859225 n=1 Tax=Homarus americanus TaxID=6706 RepID=UPI001C481416|nr:uncharacterized protein LOC121859225 [Homarus americanus]